MNIAVVSPHPDDETLGAGGTILRKKSEGNKVFWLNMTNVSQSEKWDREFIRRREQQIEKITEFYQFDSFVDLKYEPSTLEDIRKSDLIEKISVCFEKLKPEWIVLPDPNDSHKDHRITYESCMACTKIFRFPYVKRVVTMEILSETEFGNPDSMFVPNYFVDISDFLEKKVTAMQIYDTELGSPPFPRSTDAIQALATFRGGMAGCRYAEAYKIVKWIE
ncbi:MAG: PIG-L family deacetylase [Lachnospiraceae bacterium]|nr:PIG-L family deacetylase [Lachnospiraceae bacterium]